MYKIKIYLTSFLVLFMLGLGFAQTIPVSSFTVDPVVNATCLSNGSITVNIPAPASPNTYETGWLVELWNLTNTNSTASSQTVLSNGGMITFNFLSAADYRVIVRNASSTSLTPVERTITTSYVLMSVPSASIIATAPSCSDGTDGTLKLSVTGGVGPFTYSLRSTDPITKAVIAGGTNIVSASTNDRTFTFTGLKDGDHVTYTIADACGTLISADRFLAENTAADLKFALMESNFFRECITQSDGSISDCNSMKMFINLDINTMTADRLASIQTSGNSTIKINGTVYNLTYVGLLTSQAYRFTYDAGAVGGPLLNHNDPIELSFNWGCKTLVKTMNVPMPIDAFGTTVTPRINPTTCQIEYSISVFGSGGNPDRSVFYCSATSKIKIERVTSSGNVQVYPTIGEWGSFPNANQNDIFTSIAVGTAVPEPGQYRITVSDGCQNTFKTVNISEAPNPVSGIQISTITGVSEGTAGIRFGEMSNGLEYKVKITPNGTTPPTSITIQPGTAPLDYTPTTKTITFPFEKSFVGPIDIVDLPIGSYKVELSAIVTSTTGVVCSGAVAKTQDVNLVNGASYNPTFSVVEACSNSNLINYALNAQNALTPTGVALFKINSNGTFTQIATNSSLSGQFSNLASGDYSLNFSRGGNSFYSALHEKRGTFTYTKKLTIAPSLPINLGITTVFCDPANTSSNSGNISVAVASGTLIYPLTMTLYDATRANVVRATVSLASPVKEHVFSGLAAGNYIVNVVSACSGLDFNVSLQTENSPPMATASNLPICKGGSTNLSADNATNALYNIEWFVLNSNGELGTKVGEGIPITVSPEVTTTYRGVFKLKSIFSCQVDENFNYTSDINVGVLEDPKLDLLVSDIDLCPGSSRTVTISNSESGFNYEILDKIGNSYSPKAEFNGDGNDLTFILPSQVILTPGESLQVRSTRISLGCTGILTDKIVVSQSALNVALDLEGSATCPGADGKITIKAAQAGVTYAVLSAGQLLSPSVSAVGTGADLILDIPSAVLTAATNEFGVRATASGCTLADLSQKASITILQTPSITNVVHAVCGEQKGGFELGTSGGSGNYEYSIDNTNWVTSNIFSGLEPGAYTVYLKDKTLDCTVQNTLTILNHCLEITKTSTTNPNNYQKEGDVLSYSISVKNNGTADLSNIIVTDPLTGMDETIASLAVGAVESFTTNYTITTADQGKEKVDNTAKATFSYEGVDYEKSASASVPNGLVVVDLNCAANSYTISSGIATTLDVLIPYTGGTAASYLSGQSINLGNGTLTATLQAGTINPSGGNLVYRVEGTSATNSKVILPVVFGGKSCQVEILIVEPVVSSIDFTVNTYNDKNKNCVKDAGELQSDVNTNGLFIKIYDLDNKLIYSNAAVSGQFDVQSFNGLSNVIYYYIIDTNNTESDTTPNILKGWSTGMPTPSLKRYFHLSAGTIYFNTAPVSNLSASSWNAALQIICMSQEEGSIASLDCANAVFSAEIRKDEVTSGTLSVNYTGANGGFYGAQTLSSTGVTGLTATLSAGSFSDGSGTLSFTLSGTATVGGSGKFSLSIGGQSCEINFIVQDSGLSITKEATQSSYKAVGDVLEYTITVKNTGNVSLSNINVTDPLTGLDQTIASLAVGAVESLTTNYTISAADQGNEKVDNTAKAKFSFGGTVFEKSASASVLNGLIVVDLNCAANSYTISSGIATTLDVLIPYTGGTAASYLAGQPINLGNGTLTATLQAGTINLSGGNLVYRVEGTSATNSKVILPVVFGGKSCQVEILILEPNVSSIDFTVNTYNDKNKNCVKDAGELQSEVNANGLFIKIYDLDNKLVYSNAAVSGQFDVQSFNGSSNVIYYYIIDTNNTESDTTPNILKGWSTGMPTPSLKRYFHLSAGTIYFNTAPISNLSASSWNAALQIICMSQEEGSIASLDCANAVFSAEIRKDEVTSGTLSVNYTGANGGFYGAQTLSSTGVTGLTATLSAGSFSDGSGTLSFTLSGTATVGGSGKFSLSIGGQSCEINFIVQESGLSITKEAAQSSYKAVGDVLDYTITVKNTGNVALSNINVIDPLTSMDQMIASLTAGSSKVLTTTYTVKQADLDAGKIDNTAKASFTYGGKAQELTATKTVIAVYPIVSITKKATQASFSLVGDVLEYTITVKNTGNVDLVNIQVSDPLTGMNQTISNLSIGESKIFTTSYTVKQADINAGKVDNIAKLNYPYDGTNYNPTVTETVNFVNPKSLIEASNDDYTDKPLNILQSGKLGNVLDNDKLNGITVKASEVNATITSTGGLTGLSIDADGNMNIPIGSAAGKYTINYSICEKSNPTNCSEASITFELIHGVNLRIFKSIEYASWFEGNEMEFLLKVENNGTTNATNVVAVDNLPEGLRYISSTVIGATALTTVRDQQISWTFAGLAAGASAEIKVRVKAAPLTNGLGKTIVNTANVSSNDTELSQNDNSASATVRIDPFFIPNTITPNGDLTNDTFEIPGLSRFVSNELVILNRWNDQVFQTKNYQNNWAAAGLVSGTYFYILKTIDENGKVQDYKGFIQVVKESIK